MTTTHFQIDRYGFDKPVPKFDNRHRCHCIMCRYQREERRRQAQLKHDIGAGIVFAAWFFFTVWLVLTL